jgi:glycosyltransferase involved in cell wall biosynthesis
MPKISIAMATYNGGKHLLEQLESIAAQSRTPDEMVVCDDQSTDDTLDVLNAFRDRAPFPITVYNNEQRLRYARNFSKAMGLCTGDLIFPCDQDDVWLATKIQKHEAIYREQDDVGLVVNDGWMVDSELKPMGKTWFQAVGVSSGDIEQLETDRAFRVLMRDSRFCGCMMSFRSRYRDRIPPIPDLIGHDDWLALTLSLLSRLRVIPEPLNDYRQHSNQVTQGPAIASTPPSRSIPDRAAKMEKRAIDMAVILQGLKQFERPGEVLRYPEFHDYLKGHMSHYLRRSLMSNHLIKRMPLVLIEFVLGNYARYNESVKNSLSLDIRPKFFR